MTALRAAIVGTGFIARVHVGALRSLGVETVAVCGSSRARASELVAELGGGVAYGDLSELLGAEQIDALHVCTPNSFHAEQALLALERGVHVVCEKPLAVDTHESARIVEAAARKARVGVTCFHVRGYPLVEQMRAAADAGELGAIRLLHGRYFCDDALRAGGGWRLDPDRSGPSYVTADLGSHWLDLAEHVSGLRVEAVRAEFRSVAGGRLEDYAALELRFQGGATGSVLLSALAAGRKNQLLFECEGDRGGLTWDQEQPDLLLHRLAEGPSRIVLKDEGPLARYPAGHAEGYGGAFRNILRNAYLAIAGDEHAPYPTLIDGHHNVAVVEAAVASARAGEWVEVRG
jgi:predicted dehydrogenase